MSEIRTGRQKYYDIFSRLYDAFIRLHSGSHGNESRQFLVDATPLSGKNAPRILDVCCGTGSVILAFAQKYPSAVSVGVDFSRGMLAQAEKKDSEQRITFVQGDASHLPFMENGFDLVCCSHALYELKGVARTRALEEMERVAKVDGAVLIMEHEVPRNSLVKALFYLRMLAMGSSDAQEFLHKNLTPYTRIFAKVQVSHTPSGKSRLLTCMQR